MNRILPLTLFLTMFVAVSVAQTTYQASTGSIASTFVTSMNLDEGGSVTLYPNFGPSCYWPGPCNSSNASFNYSLPDGTTASFHPVTSHLVKTGSEPCVALGRSTTCPVYTVTFDPATSTDSNGKGVTASVAFTMHTQACTQPRGTCPPKKVYDSGSLSVN